MSTFGKKALVWWDYDDDSKKNVMRFNKTDPEIQLEILKKWYPIGSLCREIKRHKTFSLKNQISSVAHFKDNSTIYNWEIVDYSKTIGGYYVLRVRHVDDSLDNHPVFKNRETHIISIKAELSPDDLKRIKREARLSKLGF